MYSFFAGITDDPSRLLAAVEQLDDDQYCIDAEEIADRYSLLTIVQKLAYMQHAVTQVGPEILAKPVRNVHQVFVSTTTMTVYRL